MSNKILENFDWLTFFIDNNEEERLKRIALDQITPIDPINEIERDRVKRIALDQITEIDPINDAEIQRVKRIALNKAADTDPINTAFNLIRDQTMKEAYYIGPVRQIQNFISTQFIDYFLLFFCIAFIIYIIYNTNSRKDYI